MCSDGSKFAFLLVFYEESPDLTYLKNPLVWSPTTLSLCFLYSAKNFRGRKGGMDLLYGRGMQRRGDDLGWG